MVNLVDPLHTLEIVLGEAITTADCDVVCSYADVGNNQFFLGSANLVTNGTTPVTVVAGPALSTGRQVKEVTVYNADTVPHAVTLQLNNGSAIRIIQQDSIIPGARFTYSPEGATVERLAALLMESGVASKISTLPAFDLAAPPDGSEKFPIVEAGATSAATLGQFYALFANWLNYVATNPLDAPSVTDPGGDFQLTAGAGGATSGAGGAVGITSGSAAAGNSGPVNIASGAASGTRGDIFLDAPAVRAPVGQTLYFASAIPTGATASGSVGFETADTTGGSGASGDIFIGTSDAGGQAGSISLYAGASHGANLQGGSFFLTAGDARTGNANGGDVLLAAGFGIGTGVTGLVMITGLPTAAPATSGALWRDAGAGNVIKCVP
jgi:hypothetical protein